MPLQISIEPNAELSDSDIARRTLETGGPLKSLNENAYAVPSALQYPESLGGPPSKQHVVQFFINEIEQSSYTEDRNTAKYDENNSKSGQTFVIGNYNNIDTGIKISTEKRRLAASIQLYMPDTMQTSYTNSYQEDDLNDYTIPRFGQALVGLGGDVASYMSDFKNNKFSFSSAATNPNLLALIKDAVSGSIPVDVLLKGRGYAINPQVQLLFKATALRTFQMTFLFTPYSQNEAQSVKQIIDTFKFHAAPEIGNAAAGIGGQFFVLPSTFDIKYLYQGNENKFINKIDECVLENIEVDYATNGWITYPDGSPVQTRLTLSFKEMAIIDKNKIKQGY
jgi:hypothetical protein